VADEGRTFIQDVLSASLKSLERSLSGRRIRIIRQVDPTTPALAAEEEPLREALQTLLAEAAAGTDEGGRIRVCLKHSPAAIMVSIKDQGPGLDPDGWERRVANPERDRPPGAALSLAECRQTITSLGGNLFANSRLGKGITYYVTFPAPRA